MKESKSESELKKLADEMDEEVLWILADKILSKSRLREKQANKLAEELKERVAKRHGLPSVEVLWDEEVKEYFGLA